MKRSRTPEELVEHWSVTPYDLQAIGNKSGATRLGFVVALKYFQCEGRFPRGRQDVPWLIVSFLATQVKVPVEAWNDYRWDMFSLVSEATLRDLVAEWKASAPAYRQQVHTLMRASYRDHYRRLLPQMLECLEFRSNNDLHRPVMQALRVVTVYADHPAQTYPVEAAVPIDGVVPDKWREIVVETQGQFVLDMATRLPLQNTA